MKAIITAGGRGTRLRPITWTMNKHLIPLANEPMLFNAFKKIAAVGIKEVAVNVNPGETEIQKVCGDGSEWGINLTYIEQSGGAVGVGQIVYNAREFVGDDDVLLYFGDNIVLGSLHKLTDRFRDEGLDACLAFSKVRDPQRFGVPDFDENGNLVGVTEKPEDPKSDFAVTGIYIYKMGPHMEAFDNIEPSARGEYEISHINDWLLRNNKKVGYEEVTGWWKDTGKPTDLLEGNQLLLNEMTLEEATIDPSVKTEDNTRVQGNVKIGENCVIGPNVLIRGPVVIGNNVTIDNAYIGPHTSIGDGVTIADTEIEHSIVMEGSTIRANKRIVDSIIGKNATLISEAKSLPRGHQLVVGENGYVEL